MEAIRLIVLAVISIACLKLDAWLLKTSGLSHLNAGLSVVASTLICSATALAIYVHLGGQIETGK